MATNAVIQTVGAAGYVSLRVTQTGHGLTGRVPVYYNTSTNLWTAAQANAGNTLGTHLAKVIDSNTLLIVQSGIFPDPTHGLTAGQYYFVSDSVAGTLTVTEPTAVGSFSNPVLYVTDANTYIVLGYRSSQTVNQSFNPLLNDGTAAAPSLAFSADSDTGLYRIGANTMGIATNGTRVGEIGIGYGGFTGNVIQTVFGSVATSTNNTTTTFADSGLSATITPRYSNSDILVMGALQGVYNTTASQGVKVRIVRGSTQIMYVCDLMGYEPARSQEVSFFYIDSPATTSATTYKIQFAEYGGSGLAVVMDFGATLPLSTIVLMEIQK